MGILTINSKIITSNNAALLPPKRHKRIFITPSNDTQPLIFNHGCDFTPTKLVLRMNYDITSEEDLSMGAIYHVVIDLNSTAQVSRSTGFECYRNFASGRLSESVAYGQLAGYSYCGVEITSTTVTLQRPGSNSRWDTEKQLVIDLYE